MHEVSPSPGLSLRHVECRGKCSSLIGAFRSKSISRYCRGRENVRERRMGGRARRDSWNFDNVRVEVACFAAATTTFLSRSYSAAKKKSALASPHTPRQNPFGIALPWNSTTTSTRSLTRELHTRAATGIPQKIPRQTKILLYGETRELRYSRKLVYPTTYCLLLC